MIRFTHIRGTTLELNFTLTDPNDPDLEVNLSETTITASLSRTDGTPVADLTSTITSIQDSTFRLSADAEVQALWPIGEVRGRVTLSTPEETEVSSPPVYPVMKSQVFALNIQKEL